MQRLSGHSQGNDIPPEEHRTNRTVMMGADEIEETSLVEGNK